MDRGGHDETQRPPPPPLAPPQLPLSFLMMNPSVSSLLTPSSSLGLLGCLEDFDELVGQPFFMSQSRNGEPAATDGSLPVHEKSVGDGSGEEIEETKEKKKSTSKTRKTTRPRISFQTRSADDILDDGYRWRKYGQKAVKNSAYPRSYYRCTHHTCNVKKQVQRLSKDKSIVVTTYEGIHGHPCEKLMETLAPLLKQMEFLSSS